VAEGEEQRSSLVQVWQAQDGQGLYFKQFADFDRLTLETLVVGSVAA
jgi:hypothetical protein